MDAIASGDCVQYLGHLLKFLAAWGGRPACLTPMVYQWCSAFSEMAAGTGKNVSCIGQSHSSSSLVTSRGIFLGFDQRFTEVGPGCDRIHCVHGLRRNLNFYECVDLLIKALKIGFHLARPGRDQSAIYLNHTSHHNWMFEVAFSSSDDEIIADAICAWIADSDHTPASSFVHYFAKRVENTRPFPPRLREVGTRAICRIRSGELIMSALETVRLLNRLEVCVDDAYDTDGPTYWAHRLVWAIRSPPGFERLSSHNWRLLGKLTSHIIFRIFCIARHGGHEIARGS